MPVGSVQVPTWCPARTTTCGGPRAIGGHTYGCATPTKRPDTIRPASTDLAEAARRVRSPEVVKRRAPLSRRLAAGSAVSVARWRLDAQSLLWEPSWYWLKAPQWLWTAMCVRTFCVSSKWALVPHRAEGEDVREASGLEGRARGRPTFCTSSMRASWATLRGRLFPLPPGISSMSCCADQRRWTHSGQAHGHRQQEWRSVDRDARVCA